MIRLAIACVCAAIVPPFLPGRAIGQANNNASEADRQITAEFVREALAKELAKAKLAGSADERHRIEKNIPPFNKKLVTYWRSSVSAEAAVPDPDKRVAVVVPTVVGSPDGTITVTVTASAPLAGHVSGKATTDDRKITTGTVNSKFTCNLTVTAECVVGLARENGQDVFRVEVRSWKPAVKDLHFSNDILNLLRGEVQKAANHKLAADSEKLRATVNAALKKAADSGKLKLPR
jgi:hypothetical protein